MTASQRISCVLVSSAALLQACLLGEDHTELELPDGFRAEVVADGFEAPTSVAVGTDGEIYVSQYGGPVLRLEGTDDDGAFNHRFEYASGRYFINGIATDDEGSLYISSMGRVSIARDIDGSGSAVIEDIIEDLPSGTHQNNGLALGPDGKLYITNGSTCNDCDEADKRSATILRANPDGSELEIHASGLRNSYDLTFDAHDRLWATDNGSDPPCNTRDELNVIEPGADYGWPYGPECDNRNAGTPPIADLGFNTAATGISYYDGAQFPTEYQDNFFITLWGSNVHAPEPAGRTLVRAVVDDSSNIPAVRVEEFATGFEHPIDVAVDRDGSLLVLDFGSGELLRIQHDG